MAQIERNNLLNGNDKIYTNSLGTKREPIISIWQREAQKTRSGAVLNLGNLSIDIIRILPPQIAKKVKDGDNLIIDSYGNIIIAPKLSLHQNGKSI